jgi:hypothetical protein
VLAVFAPEAGRPVQLQTLLQQSVPGVNVTVYGRIADLTSDLAARPPDAILAPRPVLEQSGVRVDLQGRAHGTDTEAWLRVTVGGRQGGDNARVIGLLDLVGRRRLAAFAAKLLDLKDEPLVAGATKPEDLLAMLELDLAGSPRAFVRLRSAPCAAWRTWTSTAVGCSSAARTREARA